MDLGKRILHMDNNDDIASQPPGSAGVDESGSFDLLYPPGGRRKSQEATVELTSSAWHDLGIDQLVVAFSGNRGHQQEIRNIFSQIVRDAEVIRYRQDVIEDLLDHQSLADRLTTLLPVIDALTDFSFQPERGLNRLHEVSWRMGELQSIIDCIEGLDEILTEFQGRVSSQGLRGLLAGVRRVKAKPDYQSLVKNLPDMLAKLRSCASITIGVNLDAKMRPVQATLLAVNDKPFTTQSLLSKLFGQGKGNAGIASLHSVPQRLVDGPYAFPVDAELGWAVEPTLVPLFADLAKILEKTTAPIASQLKEYSGVQSDFLSQLRQGLIYYLGAVAFIQRMQATGLPMCRPEIRERQERLCSIKDSYNVNLALRIRGRGGNQNQADTVIRNNVEISPQGQVLILTGPNQGGKTTYMVGIGIAMVLAQVGCYVPGEQARISPVDNIFSHFPLEEKPEANAGRFGEEAMRLGQIFEQLTGDSLVLLNESLANTSFGESLYLAQDIVRILRRAGVRAIYSTHLHELGDRVEELNESVPGEGKIISVVSSPIEEKAATGQPGVRRSYKVEARPPLGQSYAREIAGRYGIRYEQLESVLVERGVIKG
jgi:DNA mismatch repair protein MutS